MNPALIQPFVGKNIVLTVQNERYKYIGKLIVLEGGGIVLQNDKFGLSSFDCKYIVSIQEDIKRHNKCEEELPNEKEQQ